MTSELCPARRGVQACGPPLAHGAIDCFKLWASNNCETQQNCVLFLSSLICGSSRIHGTSTLDTMIFCTRVYTYIAEAAYVADHGWVSAYGGATLIDYHICSHSCCIASTGRNLRGHRLGSDATCRSIARHTHNSWTIGALQGVPLAMHTDLAGDDTGCNDDLRCGADASAARDPGPAPHIGGPRRNASSSTINAGGGLQGEDFVVHPPSCLWPFGARRFPTTWRSSSP